jgi:hypothetical protein
VHPGEHRNLGIHVVVDFDIVFALCGAQDAPDVLDDATFEGKGEGEEQGVELGRVESLAQIGAGRD